MSISAYLKSGAYYLGTTAVFAATSAGASVLAATCFRINQEACAVFGSVAGGTATIALHAAQKLCSKDQRVVAIVFAFGLYVGYTAAGYYVTNALEFPLSFSDASIAAGVSTLVHAAPILLYQCCKKEEQREDMKKNLLAIQ